MPLTLGVLVGLLYLFAEEEEEADDGVAAAADKEEEQEGLGCGLALTEWLLEDAVFEEVDEREDFFGDCHFVKRGSDEADASWLMGMRMEIKASSGYSGPSRVAGR